MFTSKDLILHVENDSDDVLLIGRAFREADVLHRIQPVENGERAVDYLVGQHPFEDRKSYPLPGLILLDLSMPLMTGVELLKWLRQQPGIRRLPVVVLTSSKQQRDIVMVYETR